ncbi:hypothetical protein SAG0109_07660 [Streptococcus agalactiae BSU108]|nr:hypothetical protein SAG0109_07660 [Streptococcus agalactiae BSU108]
MGAMKVSVENQTYFLSKIGRKPFSYKGFSNF